MSQLIPFFDYAKKLISPHINHIVPLEEATATGLAGKIGGFGKKIGPALKAASAVGAVASGPVGAAITGAIGVGQFIGGIIKKRKAKELEPEAVDQAQATAAANLRRKQRVFESGAAASPFIQRAKETQSQATTTNVRLSLANNTSRDNETTNHW